MQSLYCKFKPCTSIHSEVIPSLSWNSVMGTARKLVWLLAACFSMCSWTLAYTQPTEATAARAHARWIWLPKSHASSDKVEFQKSFSLPKDCSEATIIGVAVHNDAEVHLNGQLLLELDGYGPICRADAGDHLQHGENRFTVECQRRSGPPAIAVELRISRADGKQEFQEKERLLEIKGGAGHGLNGLCGGRNDHFWLIHGDGTTVPADMRSCVPRLPGPPQSMSGNVLELTGDGKHAEVIATGLRNPYGLAVNRDGELFTFDADGQSPQAEVEPATVPRPFVRDWTVTELADSLSAVRTGDVENGKGVFVAALCARCHRCGDVGTRYGPDLTHIAQRFSAVEEVGLL